MIREAPYCSTRLLQDQGSLQYLSEFKLVNDVFCSSTCNQECHLHWKLISEFMDSLRSISVHFFTGDVNSLREEQSKITADSHHLSTSKCFLFAFMISKYQFMFEKTWNFHRSCGAPTAPGWQNPTALKPLAKPAVKSWTRLWMTWDERLYLDHMQRWIVRVFFTKDSKTAFCLLDL